MGKFTNTSVNCAATMTKLCWKSTFMLITHSWLFSSNRFGEMYITQKELEKFLELSKLNCERPPSISNTKLHQFRRIKWTWSANKWYIIQFTDQIFPQIIQKDEVCVCVCERVFMCGANAAILFRFVSIVWILVCLVFFLSCFFLSCFSIFSFS